MFSIYKHINLTVIISGNVLNFPSVAIHNKLYDNLDCKEGNE